MSLPARKPTGHWCPQRSLEGTDCRTSKQRTVCTHVVMVFVTIVNCCVLPPFKRRTQTHQLTRRMVHQQHPTTSLVEPTAGVTAPFTTAHKSHSKASFKGLRHLNAPCINSLPAASGSDKQLGRHPGHPGVHTW